MRLTLKEKRSVTGVVAARYQKASKKEKRSMLDEFTQLTGYNRCYASHLLASHGKQLLLNNARFVAKISERTPHGKQKIYDHNVKSALKMIWGILDCICAKRLAPMLKEVISRLEFHQEFSVDDRTRELLLKISPSTIDRLLAEDRKSLNGTSKARTRPGTLLKSQIPIKTFSDWNEQRPGFVEIDLVAHEGGVNSGEFIQSLDVTDVCSGWTEVQAVRNKAQIWVFEAIKDIRARLPFELLGIDSDNGGEFINNQMLRYCQEQKITFTRSRSLRKNDNCFVEQKNYSVVRRAVGYLRYDSEQELKLLNELYSNLRLYTNYFQPVMKMIEKRREGSKVKKQYDQAQTPYQRVVETTEVPEEKKQRLREGYERANPAQLKREITRLQNELIKISSKKDKSKDEKNSVCVSTAKGKK
jgi:hypothetical protein